MKQGYQSITATIANGAALSGAVDVGDRLIAGLIMPAAWTAAAITFAVCDTKEGTFVPLYDDGGNEVTIASANVAVSRAIALDILSGSIAQWRFLKIRSGTNGTPVNQGGDRTIVFCTKD
jgi:hypothetical protein